MFIIRGGKKQQTKKSITKREEGSWEEGITEPNYQ